MKKPIWLFLTLALFVALLASCEGGTSGSVVGSRQSCSHRVDSGTCKGGYGKLRGTIGEDIENDRIFMGDAVRVQAKVSVEEGVVRVSVQSPDDETASAEARPGEPATLEGVAEGSSEEFRVRFEAVEGEASGVSYEIAYQIP